MRLRPELSLDDLRREVDELDVRLQNFAAWSVGTDLSGLRREYLSWVRDAESLARRYLMDVVADQFMTARWSQVLGDSVPRDMMWTVVNGDATAQLDWFKSAIADLTVAELPHDRSALGPWKADHVRAFLSHLASEKAFASDVANELEIAGIHGFVAHDTIEPSLEWQDVIEEALRTCHVFVGLVHPTFAASFWAQQEVGWAAGRGIPVFMVRLGEDPRGFPAKFQAPSLLGRTATHVADSIIVWLSKDPLYGAQVTSHLVSSLRSATSFTDARDAARKIERMGQLSDPLLDELIDAYLSNNQLYPYHVGAQVLERILRNHGRILPRPDREAR